MTLHDSTFEYLKPTDKQLRDMQILRHETLIYAKTLDIYLPDGPDKTFIFRKLRSLAMWINVAITRNADGSPRI